MAHENKCTVQLKHVRDALDIISGKWKVLILISISHGNKRFREIERSIPKISSKVLAKELKDLEMNLLIKRTVYDDHPVLVEYTTTAHTQSLSGVIGELHKWGIHHREKITGGRKKDATSPPQRKRGASVAHGGRVR